jgi:flagellar hook-associated protein 1
MLSRSYDIARNSLAANSARVSVASQNISNVSVDGASRKRVNLASLVGGGVHATSVERASRDALNKHVLTSTSAAAAYRSQSSSIAYLNGLVGDTAGPAGLSLRLAGFQSSLQTLSETPSNSALAEAAVAAANALAGALNTAHVAVSSARFDANAQIATGVDEINRLLAAFEVQNAQIVAGTRTKADITTQLDTRDRIVRDLAELIGVKTLSRADGDIALFTETGITLFDDKPRRVEFDRSAPLTSGAVGAPIRVDGISISNPGSSIAVRTGALAGLVRFRDGDSLTYQSQIDDVAHNLIIAFAESDQSASPTLANITGVFTYSGGPAMPISTLGLAGDIRIASSVDPAQGGSALRIRDGGIGAPGNPAFIYNAAGNSLFNERIVQLLDGLETPRTVSPATQWTTALSVSAMATAQSGWFEGLRQRLETETDIKTVARDRSLASLKTATGIDLDAELATLLEIEKAYQISSKLLSVIDQMFQSLLASTR